jgi:predicted Zn-dependent protease
MSAGGLQALQMAAQVGFSLPHSRGQETEADIIGLELMARAGFNPSASVTLWQKMAAATGGKSSFLSTHPSSTRRISDLQANIPKVAAFYESAKRTNNARVPRIVPRT